MDLPIVPAERVLFDLACETRSGCINVYNGDAEVLITLLAGAAFQLQAAWVGARLAAMANDAEYTPMLRELATNYGGVSVAALNLAVRCSVTAVDLCGAALGRLTLFNIGPKEFDAGKAREHCKPAAISDKRLSELARVYRSCVIDEAWRETENLRNEASHRLYGRGIYATSGPEPDPCPLAYPQQIDVAHGSWGMHPLDELTERVVHYADATFREFCGTLAASADHRDRSAIEPAISDAGGLAILGRCRAVLWRTVRRCKDRGDRGWGDRPARVPGRAHAHRCRGRSPDGEATAAGRVPADGDAGRPHLRQGSRGTLRRPLGCRVEALTVVGRTQSLADFGRTIGSADIVYVGGGNTLLMMKLWRRRGVDRLLARAAADGTVMAGVSAGAICWCTAGVSDSHSFTWIGVRSCSPAQMTR